MLIAYGQVERIRLSHDNQGENPEWYLENLRIEVPSPSGGDDKYYFPCNTWLKGPERDRRVILELYPGDHYWVMRGWQHMKENY